jgi:polyphosphate glucokinase
MGLDIGGSGVKGAVVDLASGKLLTDRVRLKTPRPATPDAVMEVAGRLCRKLDWTGPVGCGFPGTLRKGQVILAPNLDPAWSGRHLAEDLRRGLGVKKVAIGNDADAAGLAEIRLGAGRDATGTVVVATFGTGIGTAVFTNGVLVPGTELGHLEMDGREAETVASEGAKKRRDWSWKRWSREVDRYLARLEYLLHVDLFIIGGGASNKADKWMGMLDRVACPVVVAQMGNLAGIVGAALMAADD